MVTHPVPLLRIFLGIGSGCGSIGSYVAFTGVFVLCSGNLLHRWHLCVRAADLAVDIHRRLRKTVLDQGTDIRRHISAAPIRLTLQLGFQIRVHFDRDALGHFFCFAHLFVLSLVVGIRDTSLKKKANLSDWLSKRYNTCYAR